MGLKTDTGFTEYRYIRCFDEPLMRSLTFYFDVNQETARLVFSWSACSANDNFCRKTGRTTAKKHFDEGKFIATDYDRELNLVYNAIRAMKDFMAKTFNSEDLLATIKSTPVSKKHYEEIVRAVDIHKEVEITNSLYASVNQSPAANLQLADDVGKATDGC